MIADSGGSRSRPVVGDPRISDFSIHSNFMMTRTEPNSSFYVIQTSTETIEVIAAIRPSGKRKIWADPRSSWMTNLGCSAFTDEEGNAISSNLITEQVDSVTE